MVRTPDVPDFDTYPAGVPSAERALPAEGESTPASRAVRLADAASNLGQTLGSAVRRARGIPQQMRVIPQEVKQRFTLIRGRARRAAAAKSEELKSAAGERLERARSRAQQLAHDHPLQVIAAVAAVAFLAGFTLRIWRSSRE